MSRLLAPLLIPSLCAVSSLVAAAPAIELDEALRERCLTILREGLKSDEFWPAMHAAEGLSVAGQGAEVRAALAPLVPKETDDQHRCGLARELVRAGDQSQTKIMVEILAGKNDYGHTHAAESLYKVKQVGDKDLMRRAMKDQANPKKALMAAAALARIGDAEAFALIRSHVDDNDGESAKVAAWILARVGDKSDLPALRRGAERFTEPLTKAYFQHALAALGDEAGLEALIRNLSHSDPAVRVYAAEFAPDARAVGARDALVVCLDDKNFDVRIRAAQALLALAKSPAADAPN